MTAPIKQAIEALKMAIDQCDKHDLIRPENARMKQALKDLQAWVDEAWGQKQHRLSHNRMERRNKRIT
jgi:hypothetical protein